MRKRKSSSPLKVHFPCIDSWVLHHEKSFELGPTGLGLKTRTPSILPVVLV